MAYFAGREKDSADRHYDSIHGGRWPHNSCLYSCLAMIFGPIVAIGFIALLACAGHAVLMLYSGPLQDVVHEYAGSVSGCFAACTVLLYTPLRWRLGKLVTTGITLFVVELLEATRGFTMSLSLPKENDLVANAMGVALALAFSEAVDKILTACKRRGERHKA